MSTKKPKTVVAIYCRKSTEEGLEKEFNTLDAQRVCCEQFIASQKGEGWVASEEQYNDGGFTGSNTERPALKRLLADVEAGKVQAIAVYKLDRLSRSLNDFVGLLQLLEKHNVAFISVTQHFNTATPMGRLMLNILICFAQFERENMIERVKDKVAMSKRQGRWCGGAPPLGYDVATEGRKLEVNEAEAKVVREIFDLYLERGSISLVVRELGRRGRVTKVRTSRAGRSWGGKSFVPGVVARILRNPVYAGWIAFEGQLYPSEHKAILDQDTFDRVQHQLTDQRGQNGGSGRIKNHALLRGLLRCGTCDGPMVYTWTRKGAKTYGYYTCAKSRVEGSGSCPLPSLPAAEIENLVLDELAVVAADRSLVDKVVAEARSCQKTAVADLRVRLKEARGVATKATESARLAPDDRGQESLARQAAVQVDALARSLRDMEALVPASRAAKQALRNFRPVIDELTPKERHRLMSALVEYVTIDGHAGKFAFTFRSDGIAMLAKKEDAA